MARLKAPKKPKQFNERNEFGRLKLISFFVEINGKRSGTDGTKGFSDRWTNSGG